MAFLCQEEGDFRIMNLIKLRGVCSAICLVAFLSLLIFFILKWCGDDILSLINKDDYIFYTRGSIPALLALPVIVCVDFFFLCLLLPYKSITVPFLLKYTIPITIYAIVALFIGFLLSFLVVIYPLSTDYYQCDHAGIMSGSHYAKSKLTCEQMKYSPAEK